MRTLLFLIALLIVSPAFAQTGKVVQCGVPSDVKVDTDPGKDYCDIYARSAAYREKDRAYRDMIEQRRENYYAPRAQAMQAFQDQQESGVSAPAPEETSDAQARDSETAEPSAAAPADKAAPINLLEGIQ